MKKVYLLFILVFILSSCSHIEKMATYKESARQEYRLYFPLVIQDYDMSGE